MRKIAKRPFGKVLLFNGINIPVITCRQMIVITYHHEFLTVIVKIRFVSIKTFRFKTNDKQHESFSQVKQKAEIKLPRYRLMDTYIG